MWSTSVIVVCRGSCVRFALGDYTVNTEAVKVCSILVTLDQLPL